VNRAKTICGRQNGNPRLGGKIIGTDMKMDRKEKKGRKGGQKYATIFAQHVKKVLTAGNQGS